MNEPNTRGAERRRDNEPAHAEKAADAAEEQSPWRAANGAREAEPQAEECAKDHRRYEKWSADQQPRRDPVT
jgi:hypothetical protein